jgi:hypothetical protein
MYPLYTALYCWIIWAGPYGSHSHLGTDLFPFMKPAAVNFCLIFRRGAVSIIRGPIFRLFKEVFCELENPICLVNFMSVPKKCAWSVWRLVILVFSSLTRRPIDSQNSVIRASMAFVSSYDPVIPRSQSSA